MSYVAAISRHLIGDKARIVRGYSAWSASRAVTRFALSGLVKGTRATVSSERPAMPINSATETMAAAFCFSFCNF